MSISRRSVLKGLTTFALAMSGVGCASSGPSSTPVSSPTASRGSILFTYQGHTDRVTSVMWSPDGKRIVSGSLDKTAQVWDAPSGGSAPSGGHPFIYRGHADAVTTVAWSPDGRHIASGSQDKTVQMWDTLGHSSLIYRGHGDAVTAVIWSPDSKYIASSSFDKTVRVWNTSESGIAGTDGHIYIYRGHNDVVTAVSWSPDGKRIASSSFDKTVQIWDAATGHMLFTYRGHTNQVTTIAWSPDSKYIASGSLDKTVQVWDVATGHALYVYRGYNVAAAHQDPTKGVLPEIILVVAWSHHSERLATVTQEYCGDVCGVVLVWDALTQQHVSFYSDLPIYALTWSPDDTRIVSTVGTIAQISLAA